jgi:hypothetical protein
MHVEFATRGREVVGYVVVVTTRRDGRVHTVRVYDSAHGVNEMHRYTHAGGKQPAEVFHRGTLGEGMRAATEQVKHGYRVMIEGWEGQDEVRR